MGNDSAFLQSALFIVEQQLVEGADPHPAVGGPGKARVEAGKPQQSVESTIIKPAELLFLRKPYPPLLIAGESAYAGALGQAVPDGKLFHLTMVDAADRSATEGYPQGPFAVFHGDQRRSDGQIIQHDRRRRRIQIYHPPRIHHQPHATLFAPNGETNPCAQALAQLVQGKFLEGNPIEPHQLPRSGGPQILVGPLRKAEHAVIWQAIGNLPDLASPKGVCCRQRALIEKQKSQQPPAFQ